jgi:hypothetical protein
VLAHRCHPMYRTFEAVEDMHGALSVDLERHVVVVPAHLALGHRNSNRRICSSNPGSSRAGVDQTPQRGAGHGLSARVPRRWDRSPHPGGHADTAVVAPHRRGLPGPAVSAGTRTTGQWAWWAHRSATEPSSAPGGLGEPIERGADAVAR